MVAARDHARTVQAPAVSARHDEATWLAIGSFTAPVTTLQSRPERILIQTRRSPEMAREAAANRSYRRVTGQNTICLGARPSLAAHRRHASTQQLRAFIYPKQGPFFAGRCGPRLVRGRRRGGQRHAVRTHCGVRRRKHRLRQGHGPGQLLDGFDRRRPHPQSRGPAVVQVVRWARARQGFGR